MPFESKERTSWTTFEHRPTVSSAVCYKDPKKALRWLEEAFGFAPSEWDKAMSVKTKARL